MHSFISLEAFKCHNGWNYRREQLPTEATETILQNLVKSGCNS